MSTNPIISINSPFVELWELDLLSQLRDLYTEVWIPRAVEKEFLRNKKEDRQESLNNAPWIKTVDLTDPIDTEGIVGLDDGETEVLALAKKHKARIVLIDERRAR